MNAIIVYNHFPSNESITDLQVLEWRLKLCLASQGYISPWIRHFKNRNKVVNTRMESGDVGKFYENVLNLLQLMK